MGFYLSARSMLGLRVLSADIPGRDVRTVSLIGSIAYKIKTKAQVLS